MFLLVPVYLHAQDWAFASEGKPTPPVNAVSNMAAADTGIYFGSGRGLNFFLNNAFFPVKTGYEDLDQRGVYSVSASGSHRFFATAEVRTISDNKVTTGQAYGYSSDRGNTWKRIDLPLDAPDADTILFGRDTIDALPVIVPQQFVTYDATVSGDTIWVATWAGGIRQSSDGGLTWKRVLVPPDNRSFISPDSSYPFFYSPVPRGGRGGDYNFLGFSVHKTRSGVLWTGSAGGINRRYQADGFLHFVHSPETNSLPGNWVTGIRSQTVAGTERVWAICWRALSQTEDNGLAFTTDGGYSWTRTLMGEKIYDLAFLDSLIVATGENGVFLSTDAIQWQRRSQFTDPDNKEVIPNAEFLSVAFEPVHRQWMIGTTQGLLLPDGTDLIGTPAWNISRRDASEEKTAIFVYPNPFSPDDDRYCRFRFPEATGAEVTVFSSDHQQVRTLRSVFSGPVNEILWDGRDAGSRRVANGVYLFRVKTDKDEWWGKLLILE